MQPPPAPPVPPAPDLVVRSDLPRLRRQAQLAIGAHASIVLLCFAAATVLGLVAEGLAAFVPVFLVIAAGAVFQIGFQCWLWGGRLAISRPLTISSTGIEAQTQQGTVVLPWEAVAEIRRAHRFGKQLIVIAPHPQAVPGQRGVEGDPALWSQLVAKGLHVGEVGLVPGFDQILPAVHTLSRGRVPIR